MRVQPLFCACFSKSESRLTLSITTGWFVSTSSNSVAIPSYCRAPSTCVLRMVFRRVDVLSESSSRLGRVEAQMSEEPGRATRSRSAEGELGDARRKQRARTSDSAAYRDHVCDDAHNFAVALALLATAILCKHLCGL